MSRKAATIAEARRFTDLPNIGPAMAADFAVLGLKHPQDLRSADALSLYTQLCTLTRQRHDPCVLDTFMAAIAFANDAPSQPWWCYTAERKRLHPTL
jgi:hypothetical protein